MIKPDNNFSLRAALLLILLSCYIPLTAQELEQPDNVEPVLEEKKDDLAISEYHTNYIISGDPDTKVQLSFQFRLFRTHPIIFAYTQRMFWRIYDESSPFSDINYVPEFFYRFDLDAQKTKSIETGYMHMSNGEDEPASRTTDIFYGRWNSGGKFISSFTLKYHYAKEDSNRDIVQYVGPYELQFQLKDIIDQKYAPTDFYLRTYTGGDFGEKLDRLSFEAGMRYRFFGSDSSPGIFIQYFSGYAEKLLTYNVRDEALRIGFSVGGDYRSESN